jgi:hypothetical protein
MRWIRLEERMRRNPATWAMPPGRRERRGGGGEQERRDGDERASGWPVRDEERREKSSKSSRMRMRGLQPHFADGDAVTVGR